MRQLSIHVFGLGLLAILAACGDPIGSPCEFVGSGFSAADNCAHRCLVHRTIHCPGGQIIQGPKICSGATQCDPGACGSGAVCYHTQDPFKKQSYCVPNDLCGELETDTLAEWEISSQQISQRLVADWELKQQRRKSTQPAPKAE